jgi:dTDP-4-amino-4,6-dideoxygalactose transaminase
LGNKVIRNELIDYLKNRGFQALFHYVPLHMSPFGKQNSDGTYLPNSEQVADTIIRLPLYDSLSSEQVLQIVDAISDWQDSYVSTSSTRIRSASFA